MTYEKIFNIVGCILCLIQFIAYRLPGFSFPTLNWGYSFQTSLSINAGKRIGQKLIY
jgi:hypothetical protein